MRGTTTTPPPPQEDKWPELSIISSAVLIESRLCLLVLLHYFTPVQHLLMIKVPMVYNYQFDKFMSSLLIIIISFHSMQMQEWSRKVNRGGGAASGLVMKVHCEEALCQLAEPCVRKSQECCLLSCRAWRPGSCTGAPPCSAPETRRRNERGRAGAPWPVTWGRKLDTPGPGRPMDRGSSNLGCRTSQLGSVPQGSRTRGI